MGLKGKGFFIWKVKHCEEGDADKIARHAKKAGLSHVLIKIANGIYRYNYDWEQKIDLVPPVVNALRSKGIAVWGWHYVFGNQPLQEARIAIRRVHELNLDGYVIDAESEYKTSGKKTSAKQFMGELRNGIGDSVPIALSSYRYPSLHPIPWNEFLEKCDYNMPQVYWLQANNPGDQLAKSLREFESPKIKYHPPIIPVGSAFREHGWQPKISEVVEFMETARELKLKAVNFWEWNACRDVLSPKHELWKVIAEYKWGSPPTIPKDIAERYIDALNTQDASIVINLYHERGVHITSARTVSGKANIQAWFGTLFNQLLPDAQFSLTGFSGSENSRHFTWNAKSKTLKVLDGSDTFGILDGEITYHYTNFTISPVN